MNVNNTSSTTLDLYQVVTDRIIELLEKGTIPWQQPWKDAGIPMNVISKRPYRGINLWLLLSLNYEQNLFLTWDQLKKLGGSVNKGQNGHIVVYWKTKKKEQQDIQISEEVSEENNEQRKNAPLLRYYKVFNVSQCRNLPANLIEPTIEKEFDSIMECEHIVNMMPQSPLISFKGKEAYYDIEKDEVVMPKMKTFKTGESYYATLFHELVHSTGSEKRLNRSTLTERAKFGSFTYSLEELIVELGSAYLCSFTGISTATINDSAAYIKGWLDRLKNDKRFVIRSSGMAQKAVDYILNIQREEAKDEVEQSEMLE